MEQLQFSQIHIEQWIPSSIRATINSLSLLPLVISLAFLCLSYLTYKDYQAFISLGRGGVPWNFYGYLFITAHRPLTLRSSLLYPPVPTHLTDKGHLSEISIPTRSGIRPAVQGVIPQRQITQQGTPVTFALTHAALSALSEKYPAKCLAAGSQLERHSKGLHSLIDRTGNPSSRGLCRESEVCHVHAFDGSLHVELHPEDAKVVIDKGWGERHPLALGWPVRTFLPEGYMLLYAPRTVEEVEILMRIVGAGMGWAMGGEKGWVNRAGDCAREVCKIGQKDIMPEMMEQWGDMEKERLMVIM